MYLRFVFLKNFFFCYFPNLFNTCVATSNAIAGADDNPGDFVPAILKNPFASEAFLL